MEIQAKNCLYYVEKSQVKSRFTLLGGKKAICRGSGPVWRAGAGARVWSSLPHGLLKESGERLGKRSPPRGVGQRELLWAYKWCSGALSCSLRGAARVQGEGNPISIDQRPKPRKEGLTESSELFLCHCPRCQRLMRAWNKICRREHVQL